jgi:hypothetical protein
MATGIPLVVHLWEKPQPLDTRGKEHPAAEHTLAIVGHTSHPVQTGQLDIGFPGIKNHHIIMLTFFVGAFFTPDARKTILVLIAASTEFL